VWREKTLHSVDGLSELLPPHTASAMSGFRTGVDTPDDGFQNASTGSFLVAQQLAYMMLVQGLCLHLAEGLRGRVDGCLLYRISKWARRLHRSMMSRHMIAQLRGVGAACWHVPIDLRAEVQRDGWGVADGVPDTLANAVSRR